MKDVSLATYTYIYIYIYVCVCIHKHIYIYIHTHIHTHTHCGHLLSGEEAGGGQQRLLHLGLQLQQRGGAVAGHELRVVGALAHRLVGADLGELLEGLGHLRDALLGVRLQGHVGLLLLLADVRGGLLRLRVRSHVGLQLGALGAELARGAHEPLDVALEQRDVVGELRDGASLLALLGVAVALELRVQFGVLVAVEGYNVI